MSYGSPVIGGGQSADRRATAFSALGVALVGAEAAAATDDRDPGRPGGGDRGVRPGQPGGQHAAQGDRVGAGLVQVGDEVCAGDVGAEEVDPPAVEAEHLAQDPDRQRVPFAVDAGHRDPALGRPDLGPGADRGQDPLADRGGGVLAGDRPLVGRPEPADPFLGAGDQVDHEALRGHAVVEQPGDDFDGAVFVAVADQAQEVVAQRRVVE
jgi:hypothetical protein